MRAAPAFKELEEEPDGAATQLLGEVAAPPAKPMEGRSPEQLRLSKRPPQSRQNDQRGRYLSDLQNPSEVSRIRQNP